MLKRSFRQHQNWWRRCCLSSTVIGFDHPADTSEGCHWYNYIYWKHFLFQEWQWFQDEQLNWGDWWECGGRSSNGTSEDSDCSRTHCGEHQYHYHHSITSIILYLYWSPYNPCLCPGARHLHPGDHHRVHREPPGRPRCHLRQDDEEHHQHTHLQPGGETRCDTVCTKYHLKRMFILRHPIPLPLFSELIVPREGWWWQAI